MCAWSCGMRGVCVRACSGGVCMVVWYAWCVCVRVVVVVCVRVVVVVCAWSCVCM